MQNKTRRWLKKYRYHIISIAFIAVIAFMAGVAISAQSENGGSPTPTEEPIATEPPIATPTHNTSYPLPTGRYTPTPTLCCGQTPVPSVTLAPWSPPSSPSATPSPTLLPSTPTGVKCDINNDGKASAFDIHLTIMYILRVYRPTSGGFENADIDNDGDIEYDDCNYCYYYLRGLQE